ncbi:winged helix-turn-helix domain-containing protein [Halomicrococcus sp. NG-SE-24]|uniref:winged helix-turn-helix domain-containing protein n=1 Tax=Halomicrococcus sp. NG-SE-24 TaxID=3436928 RepID=UPI003D975D47
MEETNSTESPLEAAAGAAGPRATEAFSVLGNETRLAILLALWDAYEPFEAENTVAFAELRKRVGMRDGSQFNYHLKQLVGHFVRHTDDGYELRRAGHQLIRTVIAGAGIEEPSLDPTEVDLDCFLCGAPTMVTYHDQWLFWVCTECDGKFDHDDVPGGALAGGAFDPAGFTDRRSAEALNAVWTGGLLHSGLGGVCDACSGPMEGWLHLCDDHTAEGVCPNCGWRDAVVARFRCGVCKRHHQMVPWWLVINHPVVVAFYYDHGVPLQYEDGVHFQPRIELNLQAHHDQELVSVDPPLVRVTIDYEGDELQLTMDEELNIIEVIESG